MIIKIADQKRIVLQPVDIFNILSQCLKAEDKIDRDKEHFWVFHLDCRNKIKLLELVSLGTLNSSLVHPREVFTRAVGLRSAQIIIAHNHPSGEASPSEEDLKLTDRLQRAGDLLGIELIDHIIVSTNTFISLKEKRLI